MCITFHNFSFFDCLILTGLENEVIGWVVAILPKAGVSANAGHDCFVRKANYNHKLEGGRKKKHKSEQVRAGLLKAGLS